MPQTEFEDANQAGSPAQLAPTAPQLSVVYRTLNDLKPDPRNPRSHSRKQIRQIAKSISTFGFNVPVLVDADLNVVAGHGRILACRQLGWATVPTISLGHLTPAQAKAFLIADNRLTENSEWNDRLLIPPAVLDSASIRWTTTRS